MYLKKKFEIRNTNCRYYILINIYFYLKCENFDIKNDVYDIKYFFLVFNFRLFDKGYGY